MAVFSIDSSSGTFWFQTSCCTFLDPAPLPRQRATVVLTFLFNWGRLWHTYIKIACYFWNLPWIVSAFPEQIVLGSKNTEQDSGTSPTNEVRPLRLIAANLYLKGVSTISLGILIFQWAIHSLSTVPFKYQSFPNGNSVVIAMELCSIPLAGHHMFNITLMYLEYSLDIHPTPILNVPIPRMQTIGHPNTQSNQSKQ